MRTKRLSLKYPGDGYYYVICQVCGKKLRAKDAVTETNPLHSQNGLVLCKEDHDKYNPQAGPIIAPPERALPEGALISPEGADRTLPEITADDL